MILNDDFKNIIKMVDTAINFPKQKQLTFSYNEIASKSQNVNPSMASASLGNLLETQILEPYLEPTKSETLRVEPMF